MQVKFQQKLIIQDTLNNIISWSSDGDRKKFGRTRDLIILKLKHYQNLKINSEGKNNNCEPIPFISESRKIFSKLQVMP